MYGLTWFMPWFTSRNWCFKEGGHLQNKSNLNHYITPISVHPSIITESDLPWLPSWLDRGALINVDAPGCGTSVVRVTSRKVFILGYSCTQRFPGQKCLLLIASKSHCRVLFKEAILV